MYGNITVKPLVQLIYANKKEEKRRGSSEKAFISRL
jgi:hypothetical protein